MADAENCILGPCTDVPYVHGWHFEQIKNNLIITCENSWHGGIYNYPLYSMPHAHMNSIPYNYLVLLTRLFNVTI